MSDSTSSFLEPMNNDINHFLNNSKNVSRSFGSQFHTNSISFFSYYQDNMNVGVHILFLIINLEVFIFNITSNNTHHAHTL